MLDPGVNSEEFFSIKMFKWKYIIVTREDYEEKLELYKTSLEKGWDRNYKRWLVYAGGKD